MVGFLLVSHVSLQTQPKKDTLVSQFLRAKGCAIIAAWHFVVPWQKQRPSRGESLSTGSTGRTQSAG